MVFSECEYQVCHAFRVTMRMTDSRKGRWPPTSLLEGKHGVGGAILMGGFPIPSVTNWETSMNKNVQSWEEWWTQYRRLPKNISLQKSVLSVGSSVFFCTCFSHKPLSRFLQWFHFRLAPQPLCVPATTVLSNGSGSFASGSRTTSFFGWMAIPSILPMIFQTFGFTSHPNIFWIDFAGTQNDVTKVFVR